MRHLWLLSTLIVGIGIGAAPGKANACSESPPDEERLIAGTSEAVGLFARLRLAGFDAEVVVERTSDGAVVTGSTFAVGEVADNPARDRSHLGVHAVFVPDAPLDVGREYRARLLLSSDGETMADSDWFRFVAEAPATTGPLEGLGTELETVREPFREACCFDSLSSECGPPDVCVAERVSTKARLVVSTDSPRTSASPRHRFRFGPDGQLFVGAQALVFDEPATSYCTEVVAVDVITGEATARSVCEAPRPGVDYGTEDVDPFSVAYERPFCLGPPTFSPCDRSAGPGECPPASEEIAQAWCAYNDDCLTDTGDPGCRFYGAYCANAEPPDGAPSSSNPGGCSAAPRSAGGSYMLGALALIACLSRRRRLTLTDA